MLPTNLAARHAWRGAFVAAVLNALGMAIDFFLAPSVPAKPWYPWALSSLAGIGLAVLLLLRREQTTVRFGSAIFLANMIVILIALWFTSAHWATATYWTPFQANKLGAMTVPLLAPRLGVGLFAIAGLTATAIAKFYVLDPDIQRRLPVGEPWVILIFALFGAVLLAYRIRAMDYEREVLRLHAETEAAEQVARTFLHLRDYTNTPVQTIILATQLLRANHPDLETVLARLERATRKLIELSSALSRYDSMHRWVDGDESLDAALLGERERGKLPGKA